MVEIGEVPVDVPVPPPLRADVVQVVRGLEDFPDPHELRVFCLLDKREHALELLEIFPLHVIPQPGRDVHLHVSPRYRVVFEYIILPNRSVPFGYLMGKREVEMVILPDLIGERPEEPEDSGAFPVVLPKGLEIHEKVHALACGGGHPGGMLLSREGPFIPLL